MRGTERRLALIEKAAQRNGPIVSAEIRRWTEAGGPITGIYAETDDAFQAICASLTQAGTITSMDRVIHARKPLLSGAPFVRTLIYRDHSVADRDLMRRAIQGEDHCHKSMGSTDARHP